MASISFHSGGRSPNWRIVLLSILGFWVLYVAIVTLRAFVLEFPSQGEMAVRRGFVTGFGMVVTILLWSVLRLFDRQTLGARITAAAMLAIPAALLISAANYYVFHVYKPCNCMEIGSNMPGGGSFALPLSTLIIEVAIDRYFFLLAWSAIYLALGFAGDVGNAEREAARFARAAQAAELRALRYQVNPHFLFNTLNSLSALVMRGRRDDAETMIMNLSHFYRTSLSSEPTEDVSLGEEIQLQRLYLDIEAVRFPERLSVVIDLPPELEAAPVPGLILQPLVENAIKHGVSRTTQPVRVRIAARREGTDLILSVNDNGGVTVAPQAQNCHGIGLANVRDRLEARFGSAARLDCFSGDTGGFEARITIPLVTHDE